MKQLLSTLFIFSITSAFIACGDSKTASANTEEIKPAFDLAGAKKSIEDANAAFGDLVSKSDSAGLAGMYTSDAKMLGANMPAVSGRAGIQSAFHEMLGMGIAGAKLTTVEVWGNESMISEEGTYTLSDKNGKELDKGKYIVLWKMEDGKWKLFRDCFNSDMPPMAPAK